MALCSAAVRLSQRKAFAGPLGGEGVLGPRTVAAGPGVRGGRCSTDSGSGSWSGRVTASASPRSRPATRVSSIAMGCRAGSAGPSASVLRAAWTHHLLPEAYLYGQAFVLRYADRRAAYLNGRVSWTGWWYYFPYCFAVKTPLPTFAVLLLAAGTLLRRRKQPDSGNLSGPSEPPPRQRGRPRGLRVPHRRRCGCWSGSTVWSRSGRT